MTIQPEIQNAAEQDYFTASKTNYRTTTAMASNDEEPTEDSPLLHHNEQPRSRPHFPRRRTLRSSKSIMMIILLVVLLTSFGDQLIEAPSTRIFESVICYRYFETADPDKIKLGREVVGPGAIGGVDEMWCKADAVQDELAMLTGMQTFFDGFPALVLAMPFGWAADRWGRWPFLFLNLVQFAVRQMWTQFVTWNWQAFDIRMIWLASGFSLLGGGAGTASAMFFVTTSDVTPEKERAGAFLRLGASNICANLFMPPIAAALMTINPWIPNIGGTALQLVAALLCLLIPETLGYAQERASIARESYERNEPQEEPADSSLARRLLAKIKSTTSFITNDWRISALVAPFVLHIILGAIGRLLLQYVSKRYALTMATGTLLLTVYNGVRVLLLFAVLPYLSTFVMQKFGLCTQTKDLYLTRASYVLMALGWLFVAASPDVPTVAVSLTIASLGAGAAVLLRSFLTSLLPAHHIARTYSLISIVDTLALMFGPTLLAGLFKQGLALGGGWVGLPFYLIGILSAFFAGLMFVVRLRKDEGSNATVTEE